VCVCLIVSFISPLCRSVTTSLQQVKNNKTVKIKIKIKRSWKKKKDRNKIVNKTNDFNG